MKKRLLVLSVLLASCSTYDNYNSFIEKGCIIENIGIEEKDKVTTSVEDLIYKVSQNFTYQNELGEKIKTPSQAYYEYLNGGLKDDCDGWVSLAYHILENNGADCYFSAFQTKQWEKKNIYHCVLVFNYSNDWYVSNYGLVYKHGEETKEETLKHYASQFCYWKEEDIVWYKCDTKYSYTTGLFYGG